MEVFLLLAYIMFCGVIGQDLLWLERKVIFLAYFLDLVDTLIKIYGQVDKRLPLWLFHINIIILWILMDGVLD